MSAYLVKPDTCNSLPMENNKSANQKTTCTDEYRNMEI